MDGLERELGDDALVLRLDVADPTAAPFTQRYRVFVTPTFLVFNDEGEEIHRQSGGLLKRDIALDALRGG
ncbi:MAG: thioredoxin family protein [Dehalococcoidia bacterium]